MSVHGARFLYFTASHYSPPPHPSVLSVLQLIYYLSCFYPKHRNRFFPLHSVSFRFVSSSISLCERALVSAISIENETKMQDTYRTTLAILSAQ